MIDYLSISRIKLFKACRRAYELKYKEGLIPGNRLYVHLSPDKETAMTVGSRHGTPYVICIDCKRMVSDGCKFWKSNNGVWLTEQVNPKYFKENDY